eukprot:TRINITY_DN6684_c0_g1_i1.p1 TRINITY_DN6684_c0_g1~~TRINITY_DN6684_c0_g1_i1.p1  ORF type:complete len:443 (+),score=82.67 TRINITY_DN6684_c0_g1_i1:56-1330(+)
MAPAFENPKTTHYEFMGVPGSIMMPIGLPIMTYALYYFCNNQHGDSCAINVLPEIPSISDLYTHEALLIVLAWFFYQAVLYIVLPGPVHRGLKLRDGSQLEYDCNGLAAFWVSILTVLGLHFADIINLAYIYHNFVPLATGAIILSFGLSLYLYIKAVSNPNAMLAEGGNSDYGIYNFFIGHELNPRIGERFDLKFFCELRPGLIGWVVICFGMMAAQYEKEGSVTVALILVTVFQFWYVLDALVSEPAVLTTMDICMDGFGFMLAYGDLAWVPFTYSLQARYLVDFPQHLSYQYIAFVLAVQFLGYYIFRGANGQKDQFKRDPTHPSVKHLETIPTSRGTKLIASGWWGVARHINYFGDLLMALAWSLPCGFNSVIPYFYPIYFAVLLWHRELRDEHKCSAKYGKAWDEYCKRVPYRIIPYVY